jgi:hypothetical protein
MSFRDAHPIGASGKREHATSDDFCELFTEDMNSLYLLSLVLTVNRELAERCLVAGLAECVDENPCTLPSSYG